MQADCVSAVNNYPAWFIFITVKVKAATRPDTEPAEPIPHKQYFYIAHVNTVLIYTKSLDWSRRPFGVSEQTSVYISMFYLLFKMSGKSLLSRFCYSD